MCKSHMFIKLLLNARQFKTATLKALSIHTASQCPAMRAVVFLVVKHNINSAQTQHNDNDKDEHVTF